MSNDTDYEPYGNITTPQNEYVDTGDGLPDFQKLPAYQYDTEWIKFMRELAENDALADIVSYINSCKWTGRQKEAIMAYTRGLLSRLFGTTLITSHRDYMMLLDDKALLDCDLPVGLTRYDQGPEWHILLGLIDTHFKAEARKSKGGFFLKRIGAQRQEIDIEDRNKRQEPQNAIEKTKMRLGL